MRVGGFFIFWGVAESLPRPFAACLMLKDVTGIFQVLVVSILHQRSGFEKSDASKIAVRLVVKHLAREIER